MTRLTGVLLFLPVPLVLWLFTWMPWGAWISVGVGVVIVATHRLYARPWALRGSDRRCFWCGRTATPMAPLEVADPFGAATWTACSAAHADAARRTVGFAERHARLLQAGILGALAIFVFTAPPSSSGWLGDFTERDAANVFRFLVAVSVLPLGWLGPSADEPPAGPQRAPFPVHIQALVGTRVVVWLFRLVGLAWLVVSARALLARF